MDFLLKCPVCNDNFLYEYIYSMGDECLKQSCRLKINHNFYILSKQNIPFLLCIELDKKSGIFASFNNNSIMIVSKLGIDRIPYFKPDLSNYFELVNRLKKLILIS